MEHTYISIGRQHTDRFKVSATTTLILCKVLLSSLALADTEVATSYQLITCFVSMLSLRYSHSLRITAEQPYFHMRVHNTFAFVKYLR